MSQAVLRDVHLHDQSGLPLFKVVPLPLLEGLPARLPLHHILAAATGESDGGIAEVRQLPYQCLAARLQPDRSEALPAMRACARPAESKFSGARLR